MIKTISNPDPLRDQFFLTDEKILEKIVGFASIKKTDIVLEVGAGTGNLTEELAKKAKRIITFEIDNRFKPFLEKLPKNVLKPAVPYRLTQGTTGTWPRIVPDNRVLFLM